jgi:chromate reductase
MNIERPPIRIVAICGTVRPGSYTKMALRLACEEIDELPSCQSQLIDPIGLDLPFPGGGPSDDGAELRRLVSDASGVILATPEYHGTFSSTIKLVIENLGFPSVLAGKPVALLGVAAGQIGAIKSLESLRGVCSHVGAIVLPGPISVAHVREAFDDSGRCVDERVEKSVRSVGTAVIDYVQQNVCPRRALEEMVRDTANAS